MGTTPKVNLSEIREKFYTVQQSAGYELLVSFISEQRSNALRNLESCSAGDLLAAQAEYRAWDQVASALGCKDGEGSIQDFLAAAIDKKPPKAPLPGLRVPGNR